MNSYFFFFPPMTFTESCNNPAISLKETITLVAETDKREEE